MGGGREIRPLCQSLCLFPSHSKLLRQPHDSTASLSVRARIWISADGVARAAAVGVGVADASSPCCRWRRRRREKRKKEITTVTWQPELQLPSTSTLPLQKICITNSGGSLQIDLIACQWIDLLSAVYTSTVQPLKIPRGRANKI